eukprot:13215100-Alexandrium_andersonii.AAC.1
MSASLVGSEMCIRDSSLSPSGRTAISGPLGPPASFRAPTGVLPRLGRFLVARHLVLPLLRPRL